MAGNGNSWVAYMGRGPALPYLGAGAATDGLQMVCACDEESLHAEVFFPARVQIAPDALFCLQRHLTHPAAEAKTLHKVVQP